jgi:hypothetical protein
MGRLRGREALKKIAFGDRREQDRNLIARDSGIVRQHVRADTSTIGDFVSLRNPWNASSRVLSESSQGMKRLSPRQADAALEVLKARVGT